MKRTWSDEVGPGWRVAAIIEGVRREGVLIRHSGETVKFRDDAGTDWVASRDRIEAIRPPKYATSAG